MLHKNVKVNATLTSETMDEKLMQRSNINRSDDYNTYLVTIKSFLTLKLPSCNTKILIIITRMPKHLIQY